MVNVYPGAVNPSHEISLSDGIKTWGIKIDSEGSVIKEEPISQIKINGLYVDQLYSEFESGMTYVEQRSWMGGMSKKYFLKDQEGYSKGVNLWSLADGKLMPAPQWEYANGLNRTIEKTPGNMSWIPIRSDQSYISFPIQIEGGELDLKHLNLWVKKSGVPGDLSIAIYSDNGGIPDQLISGSEIEINADKIEEMISKWAIVEYQSSVALSNNSTYHVLIQPEKTGTAASHWSLGVDKEVFTAKKSIDGIGWKTVEYCPYFRLSEGSIDRRWLYFNYANALYAVDQRDDGTASSLFINGDRGKSTSGDGTNILDTTKNWDDDIWAGARVKISKGAGMGQSRLIVSNGNGNLEVEGWNINPDSSSEYVIYSTEAWQDITPSSGDMIDGVVVDVSVINDQVILAQGETEIILKMRWNGSANPPAHEFSDDGTNKADLVLPFHDKENGLRLWKVLKDSTQLNSAAPANWGTTYSFGPSIPVGSSDDQITKMFEHDGGLRVFKTDGLYDIFSDNTVQKIVSDISHIRSDLNGGLCLSRRKDLYFTWGNERIFFAEGGAQNNNVVSIETVFDELWGKFQISALIGHPKGFLTAVDGGDDGFSLINIYVKENQSWHEIFRSPNIGMRIDNMVWQDCGENNLRLWVSYAGEMLFIDWPKNEDDPSLDVGQNFHHEAILVTSIFDLGTARVRKLFKELTLITRNLVSGTEIHVEYQSDSEIGAKSWSRCGIIYRSSEDSLDLNLVGKKQIRFRFRFITDNSLNSPIIISSILEALIRTPVKYQWSVKVKLNEESDEFINWLKDSAGQANCLKMRSIWGDMDQKIVVIDPPSIEKNFKNSLSGAWGGTLKFKIKEF